MTEQEINRKIAYEVGEPVEVETPETTIRATWLGTVAGPQDFTRAIRLMCNLEREHRGLPILVDDGTSVVTTD